MARYSTERKQNILSKLLPPLSMSVAEVAAQEGISTATIYYWKQQAQKRGEPVPGKTSTTEQWSAETKLATVMATATLNETQLSEYCRSKGLYPEQVKRWKQTCLSGFTHTAARDQAHKQASKADKKLIKQLQGEVRRKDRALAEAAALLVLQKKLEALWEESEDN